MIEYPEETIPFVFPFNIFIGSRMTAFYLTVYRSEPLFFGNIIHNVLGQFDYLHAFFITITHKDVVLF